MFPWHRFGVAIHLDAITERLLSEYRRQRKRRPPGSPLFTMARLLERTGLPIDRSTLHRKLHGEAPITIDEAGAVARALGLRMRSSARIERAA